MVRWLLFVWFGCLTCSALGETTYRLLVVQAQDSEPYNSLTFHLLDSLAASGYVQGENLQVRQYSIANAEGIAKRVKRVEANKDYDAVFLSGTLAGIYFKDFIASRKDTNFVFGAITDPISVGLIQQFDVPTGTNVSGVAYPVRVEERLQFLIDAFPGLKNIGYVHGDMPQSVSYLGWLQDALAQPEFSHLNLITHKIPLVSGDKGTDRMILLARDKVHHLRNQVDIFLSPNDQLGVQPSYAKMIHDISGVPVVGLGSKEVIEVEVATVSIHPDLKQSAQVLAQMIITCFRGGSVGQHPPRWSKSGVAWNPDLVERYADKIHLPALQ